MSLAFAHATRSQLDEHESLDVRPRLLEPRDGRTSVAPDLALLGTYDAHRLTDLQRAALMDRVDTKFAVPRELLASVLRDMRESYTALEIAGERSFRYRNEYYDDAGYGFYRAHHAGRANRFKVRRRDYLDSGLAFLEVKFKDNRGRTIKTRVPAEVGARRLDTAALTLLDEVGVPNAAVLDVVQDGRYRRVALASEARGERLTIDCDLMFRSTDGANVCRLGPWVLLELKQARLDRSSPFLSWARARRLRPLGFSKYCMGVYAAGPAGLARNRFHGVARRVALRDATRRSLQSLRANEHVDSP